jgi:hypothetical protein
MNPWPFVIAAYGIVLFSSAIAILWAWRSMTKAEALADEVTGR